MSDDLFEPFESDDVFLDDEEERSEQAPGESQNKMFIIAVGILSGLLVCAIAAFMVWALVINPRMQAAQLTPDELIDSAATMTVEALAMEQIVDEPEEEPTATPTLQPTDTPAPTPTATPLLGPTPAPEEEDAEAEAAVAEEPEETPEPRRTPTATPQPSPTPTAAADAAFVAAERTPDTGWGEMLLVLAAGLLLGVLFFARRLRHA